MSLDTLITHNLLDHTAPTAAGHGVALVLMGGGARTAYQAGVLRALARMLDGRNAGVDTTPAAFPFRWLFGTSAGAIGAAFLASRAENGIVALEELADFWSNLRSQHVYQLDTPDWVRANRLLAGLTLARQVQRHHALLDSMPLVDSLHRAIDLPAIERALQLGQIEALGVTASSYTSGEHWTFCQVSQECTAQAWQRPGRRAVFEPIGIEHLMASSAIPFLYPAVPLWVGGRKEHFGDGSMRQLSPLSPAIHFGARRILAIGVGQPQRAGLLRDPNAEEPTAGTIAGHAMASVFHDTLQADVEQVQRVSETLQRLPPGLAAALPYRPVSVLALQPSQSLDELALKHIRTLPRSTRNTLTGLGVLDIRRGAAGSAAALASYLLFEPDFVQALIMLGEADARRRRDELLALFDTDARPDADPTVP